MGMWKKGRAHAKGQEEQCSEDQGGSSSSSDLYIHYIPFGECSPRACSFRHSLGGDAAVRDVGT